MKAWIAGALAVTLAMSSANAQGPLAGPLDATLRSSRGKSVRLSDWRGKPVILFYEDKNSTELNARLKEELFTRGRQQGLLEAAWVVAVANLKGFNFFPAKQIALSHVRDTEKEVGVPILVDLEGTLGKEPWNLPTKTSSVLLLAPDGTVVFHYSGRMKEEDIAAFFDALSRLLGVNLGAEPQP